MVKNSPENAVARVQSDEDQRDARHFTGTLPRSLAVVAAGLGVGVNAGPPDDDEKTAGRSGLSLCAGDKKRQANVDFGDVIGKELQNLFDDLVAQPVPDRFLNLLNQLEKNMVSSGMSAGAPGERE